MVKIAMFRNTNGALLVIWNTSKGKLIGEVYFDGVEKHGKNGSWDMRADFSPKDCDATIHRVCEYFGFNAHNSWWLRWP